MKPTDTPTFTGKLYIRADHLVIKGEPVAWELRKGKTDRVLLQITNDRETAHNWKCSLEEVVPLYTAPPSSLTKDEMQQVLDSLEIGLSAQYVNDAEFYSGHISENSNKIRAAIAILKEHLK